MNLLTLPNGTMIDLPQEERDQINEIIEFWFPPKGADRHLFMGKEQMGLHFSSKNDELLR